jgi:hypothetical protein
MKLTSRELATVLAALRCYQIQLDRSDAGYVEEIATCDYTFPAMGNLEIDDLCERINGGDVDPIEVLQDEYVGWCSEQGLNLCSADEHHSDPTLTPEQRFWLRDFSARWEAAL